MGGGGGYVQTSESGAVKFDTFHGIVGEKKMKLVNIFFL